MKENRMRDRAEFFGGVGFPKSNIHLVRAVENESAVASPLHANDALHSLRVINFSGKKRIKIFNVINIF